MNLIRHAFSTIWLVEILKILKEEQLLIKFWEIKHLILLKTPKYDGYQRGPASMVYIFFDKKSAGGGVANIEIKQKFQLVNELRKPVIRNF